MLSGNTSGSSRMASSPEEVAASQRRVSKDHTSPSSGYHSSTTPPRHHHKPPAPPAPTARSPGQGSSPAASGSTSQTLSDLKKQRSMSRVKHPSPQLPSAEPMPHGSRRGEQYELNKKQHHHHRQSSAAANNVIEEDRKFASTNSEVVGPMANKKKGCCKIM